MKAKCIYVDANGLRQEQVFDLVKGLGSLTLPAGAKPVSVAQSVSRCNGCGGDLLKGNDYCHVCGHPVSATQRQEARQRMAQNTTQDYYPDESNAACSRCGADASFRTEGSRRCLACGTHPPNTPGISRIVVSEESRQQMATKYTAYWRWEDTQGHVCYEVINYGNRNIGNQPAQTEHGLLLGETVEGLRKERDEWKAKADVYLYKINHLEESEASAGWSADRFAKVSQRANELSDTCGTLRTANMELLAENAQLRRTIEKLERRKK